MKIGKLDFNILEEVILNHVNKDILNSEEILVSPSIGEDCCILKSQNEHIILSTDPITATSKSIGKLAVNININDISASGGEPIGIMPTILLPEGTTEAYFKEVMSEIIIEVKKFGLKILGGHTEITDAVTRPVISCTIIGKTKNKKFTPTSGAIAGQSVVMTKFTALEGTSIIFNEKLKELKTFLSTELIDEVISLSELLNISKESKIAFEHGATCMHDATEGGVLGACWELAKASNCGINIFIEKIPILTSTKKICNYFNINPYKLISSGVLIITTFDPKNLVKKLEQNGINSAIIGEILQDPSERFIHFKNQRKNLKEPKRDEIYKINL